MSNKIFVKAAIVLLFVVFLIFAIKLVNRKIMREAIESYSGDGKSQYIATPMPLGTDGCSIEMPHFDLMKSPNVQYNLTGIPTGNAYDIYLAIINPESIEDILKGKLSITLRKGSEEILSLSSVNEKIIHTSSTYDRLYFDKGSFNVKNHDSSWSLFVSYKNRTLKRVTKAYILIKRGGYK